MVRCRHDLVGEASAQRGADRLNGERSGPGNLPGKRLRLGLKISEWNKAIEQPDRCGVVAVEPSTGVEQFGRALLTDEAWQRHRKSEAVMKSEPREVRTQPRFWCSDAEVGCKCQAEATTDRCALDRRDDRFARPEQSSRSGVQLGRRVLPLPGEVSAGTEVFAVSRKHDDAHRVVVIERFE